jgi:hypothetical protein
MLGVALGVAPADGGLSLRPLPTKESSKNPQMPALPAPTLYLTRDCAFETQNFPELYMTL